MLNSDCNRSGEIMIFDSSIIIIRPRKKNEACTGKGMIDPLEPTLGSRYGQDSVLAHGIIEAYRHNRGAVLNTVRYLVE